MVFKLIVKPKEPEDIWSYCCQFCTKRATVKQGDLYLCSKHSVKQVCVA